MLFIFANINKRTIKKINNSFLLVGMVWGFYFVLTVFQLYHGLEATNNQSLKLKWRDRESNPGPLAPQAKE